MSYDLISLGMSSKDSLGSKESLEIPNELVDSSEPITPFEFVKTLQGLCRTCADTLSNHTRHERGGHTSKSC